jgi:pyruvate dehydrogenase E2 component (dihydrolipoamide acetyltransferase)
MAEVIRMPHLSDTMEEGNIVEWLVKVGDSISAGDVLAEVETDKATMELESFDDGTLLYIGVEKGAVPVDDIIAIIGEKGEDVDAILKEAQAASPAKAEAPAAEPAAPAKEAPASKPAPAPVAATPPAQPAAPAPSSSNGRIKASPLAKSMASERGIDLSLVSGTGDGGRVTKRDIENYVPAAAPASTGSVADVISTPTEVAYGDHPVSQMRKVIARRLAESKYGAPHFYLTVEIDMDNAIAARKMVNDAGDVRISFNDFVVKASAMALKKHPAINSSWHGDKITVHDVVNIGVAVAVDDGLLVPVVRDADKKTMSYINQEVRTLAGKAKNKKLQPQEMQGNTFTISNLGMFDIEEFTAIINPPDACILAVGSIVKKPVVKGDQIVVGNRMKVTLSCDHRVVDGAKGAQFLKTFKANLENPVNMLV